MISESSPEGPALSPDSWHMKRALRLAGKGLGWTLPNPMVGAVLVKEGERIGEGYHHRFGTAHAEVEALLACREAGFDPSGATLYVTLEPCSHQGKTPPCVGAILESGIRKVIIAELDPSEKVHGKGVEILQGAGVEVEVGLSREEARNLNRFFYTLHEKKRPWITLKVAMSLDGKIAESKGVETRLTGMPAKRYVHALRHEHQAILVGAGTVLADDPHLGVREVEGRDPLRIILKGKRKLPSELQIFRDENILLCDGKDLKRLMTELAEKEICSILVEGGQEVFTSFLDAGLVDECQFLYAPRVLGAKSLSFSNATRGFTLTSVHSKILGKDILVTGKPEWD